MKILLLGGTSEAKAIAKELIALELEVIYSIAGLVRKPILDCEIIQGGFSHFSQKESIQNESIQKEGIKHRDGLTEYLLTEKIDYLLDVTHPFASKMTQQAIRSAQEVNIPYCAFVRPKWEAQEGDDWSLLEDENQLLNELALAVNVGSKNIFYTNGQLSRELAIELDAIAELNESFGPTRYIVRSAKETELPQHAHWIQAIGPFSFDDERDLLVENEVDLIVSKNSGGEATRAKLEAARGLGIRVLMLQRPLQQSLLQTQTELSIVKEFNTLAECVEDIKRAMIKIMMKEKSRAI